MPSIANVVKRFTKQTLAYWAKIGSDKYGKPTFAAPVLMACRWEDKIKQMLMADGRLVIYKAYLLLQAPVTVGGMVFLCPTGQTSDVPGYPNVPTVNQGAREILIANSTPDLKAQGFVNEAYL